MIPYRKGREKDRPTSYFAGIAVLSGFLNRLSAGKHEGEWLLLLPLTFNHVLCILTGDNAHYHYFDLCVHMCVATELLHPHLVIFTYN